MRKKTLNILFGSAILVPVTAGLVATTVSCSTSSDPTTTPNNVSLNTNANLSISGTGSIDLSNKTTEEQQKIIKEFVVNNANSIFNNLNPYTTKEQLNSEISIIILEIHQSFVVVSVSFSNVDLGQIKINGFNNTVTDQNPSPGPNPDIPSPQPPKPDIPSPQPPKPDIPSPQPPKPDSGNKFQLTATIQQDITINEGQNLKIIPNIKSNINIDDNAKYKVSYRWLYKKYGENDSQLKPFSPNQNNKIFNLVSTSIDYNGIVVKLEISISTDSSNTETFFSNECSIVVIPNNTNDLEKLGTEGKDYFYLPGAEHIVSNRITIKTTKNELIKQKFGTVPLPWKPDSEITDLDIKNMFTVIVLARYNASGTSTDLTDLNFGARNLDANNMAIQWAKWILEYWNVFPYLVFENGALAFGLKDKEGIPPVSSPQSRFPVLNGIISKWASDLPGPGLVTDPTAANKFINNTQYFVKDLTATGTNSTSHYFNDDILRPGRIKEKFYNLLIYLFSQIRPNMSDIDKFLTTFLFVINWLKYGSSVMLDNLGVCADYSSLLAFCLNVVGIKALPMPCNVTKYGGPLVHQVVWVYLDPYNYDATQPGNPQWYLCDPTFFDTAGWGVDGQQQISKPSAMMGRNNFQPLGTKNLYSVMKLLLRSPSESQFTPLSDITEQYSYSQFFMAPWNVYSSNNPIGKVRTGSYSYYTDQKESTAPNSFLFIEPNSPDSGQIVDRLPPKWYPKNSQEPWKSNWNFQRRYSRTVFNNGYYYWLVTTANFGYSNAQNLETYLVRAKAGAVPTEEYKGTETIPHGYGNKYEPIEKVDVPENLINLLLNTQSQQLPVLQQWNNWMIFLQREQKKLILFQFNNDGIDWSSKHEIMLDAKKDYSAVIDFYIDFNGLVHFLTINKTDPIELKDEIEKWGGNSIYSTGAWNGDNRTKVVSEKLSPQDRNLIFNFESNQNITKDDVQNAYNFFFLYGGTNAIGDDNFEVTVEKRKKYYTDLNAQLKLASNNSVNNANLIKEMNKIYNEYNNSSFIQTNEVPLISTKLNSKYSLEKAVYDEFGYDFNSFKLYMNFNEMMNGYLNNSTKYNIYFNKSNHFLNSKEFIQDSLTQKVVENSYSPTFDKNILADPYGYFVIETFNPSNPNEKNISNIIEFTDEPDIYNSGKLKVSYENPEIKPESNITNYSVDNKAWFDQSINLNLDWAIPLGFKWELNYINLDTKKLTIIDQTNPTQPGFVQRFHYIGAPNNNNHGIYYFRVYNDSIDLYTNFVFIATKQDIEHYDSKQWSSLFSKVI